MKGNTDLVVLVVVLKVGRKGGNFTLFKGFFNSVSPVIFISELQVNERIMFLFFSASSPSLVLKSPISLFSGQEKTRAADSVSFLIRWINLHLPFSPADRG